jgi:hypothetical protein
MSAVITTQWTAFDAAIYSAVYSTYFATKQSTE